MSKAKWFVIALVVLWVLFRTVGRMTMTRWTTGPKDYMGSLRSAVSIYYSDTEGIFPSDLQAVIKDGKYLPEAPLVGVYSDGDGVHPLKGFPHPPTREILNSSPTDSGKWGYVSSEGHVYIDCTHTDTRGSVWSTW